MPKLSKPAKLAGVACLGALLAMYAGWYKSAHFVYASDWWWVIAILGALVGTVSGVMAARSQPRQFEQVFAADSWKPAPKGFRLVISRSEHGVTNPKTTTVFRKTPSGYDKVACEWSVSADHEIRISAPKPFAGKVVVVKEK